jgi:thioredoxin 1
MFAEAAAEAGQASSTGKREGSAPVTVNSSVERESSATVVSKASNSDSKQVTANVEVQTGQSGSDVEAILGKAKGKLQTAQGALWLYADWRVQFDHSDKVLKVEKDQPIRLNKVDPRFIAAADEVSRAAAARAAEDDAARIKAALPQVEDVRDISNGGASVDLPALLADDKITIVDFYAPWCGPCRKLSPLLETLASEDPDIVLVKVDIVNWNTPVAQQFGLKSIPNVRVFNKAKSQIGDGTSDIKSVTERVKEAKGS